LEKLALFKKFRYSGEEEARLKCGQRATKGLMETI